MLWVAVVLTFNTWAQGPDAGSITPAPPENQDTPSAWTDPVTGSDTAVVADIDAPTVEQLVARISDPDADLKARRASAVQLLMQADNGQAGTFQALVSLLDPDRPVALRRIVLDAIQQKATPRFADGLADVVLAMRTKLPAELEQPWAEALGRFELDRISDRLATVAADEQAELAERRLAILALGEHRRRFAAKGLLELTTVDKLAPVQNWAYDALANLSHETRLGRDRAAWAEWYSQATQLSASEWQRMLHDNLLRHQREQGDVDRLIRERLLQTQRALYRATSEANQPTLLIDLLQDPLDSVRSLAMELARQRAEDNGEFGQALREQLRMRLVDSVPRIRVESATLLGQLLDADAADRMAELLVKGKEGEASVNQAYLLALAQMPRETALAPAYDMLQNPNLQRSAAAMLAASYRAEQGSAAFWATVLTRVRASLEEVQSPRPSMVTLLGLVIAEDDTEGWSRIGGWLSAKDDRVREAAARVWAGSSRSLAVLAERSDDPVIRPIALKAIAERGSREATLRAVAARRPTEQDDVRIWEQAMVALAGRVPPSALLDVIDTLADRNGETRQVREHMLTAAIDRADRPDPPGRDDLRLLTVRAQVRILADAPALVVLDYEAALQHADKLTARQLSQARRGLVRAYLTDRRVADALKTSAVVLKPEGKLIENAAADPLVDVLILAAKKAAEQGRKEDSAKVIAGVRKLMGEAIPAEREAELLAIQAELDREAPADPAPAS